MVYTSHGEYCSLPFATKLRRVVGRGLGQDGTFYVFSIEYRIYFSMVQNIIYRGEKISSRVIILPVKLRMTESV